MVEFVLQYGYLGLFLISFLAATLVPLASELVVVAMANLDYNVWLLIVSATGGSFLGSVTNFWVGRKGSDFIFSRFFQVEEATRQRAERLYERWGAFTLFFSWVPFIGDPLTVVGGALGISFRLFVFWVLLGKTLRYIALLGLAAEITSWFA